MCEIMQKPTAFASQSEPWHSILSMASINTTFKLTKILSHPAPKNTYVRE